MRASASMVRFALAAGLLAAGTVFLAPTQSALAKKPPKPATDYFPVTTAGLALDMDGDGDPDIKLLCVGPTQIRRQPGAQEGTFDTEMVSMDLRGHSPALGGPVVVRTSPDQPSHGQTTLTDLGGGALFDSFFDVFFEIEVADPVNPTGGQRLTAVAEAPVRVQALHTQIPPEPSTPFRMVSTPVVLRAKENPAMVLGTLLYVVHVPSTPRKPPPPEERKLDLLICLWDLLELQSRSLLRRTQTLVPDIGAIGTDVDGVSTRLGSVEMSLGNLGGTLAGVDTVVRRCDTSTFGLPGRLDTIDTEILQMSLNSTQGHQALSQEHQTLAQDHQTLRQEHAGLSQDHQTIIEMLNGISGQLQVMDAKLDQLLAR